MNLEQLRTFKPQIEAIAAEHGVGNIRVFGSVARGEADDSSDVDLLVSIEKLMGWKFFGLEPALKEALGRNVDVVTDDAIHQLLREQILREAVVL